MERSEIKKSIFLAVILVGIVALTIFLPGCGNKEAVAEENLTENVVFELEQICTSKDYIIELYRDTTTNIIYLRDSDIHSGGYTVMPDPETGLPLTYDRFLEIYTVREG